MPTVSCPGCRRKISLTFEELESSIECAKCGRKFFPMSGESIQEEKRAIEPPPTRRLHRGETDPETKRCPYCSEKILATARKCKHCGEMLDPDLRAEQQPRHEEPPFRRDVFEDDDSAYTQEEYRRAASRLIFVEGRTDPFGIIGLIFGSLSVVCILMGCFTCGMTYFAAAPFAMIGAGLAFFGTGNLKIASVTLNLVALIPAVILAMLFAFGVALGPATRERAQPTVPVRPPVLPRRGQ